MTKSTLPTGMTDCVSRVGTQGRLTMAEPSRMTSTRHPAHPATRKNAITTASPATTTGIRHGRPSRRTRLGKPMCARFRAASAAP